MKARAAATFVAACLVAGCSATPRSDAARSLSELPAAPTAASSVATATQAPATPVPASLQACEEHGLETASVAPDPGQPTGPGTLMETIRRRGQLRVGVDENTPGFSAFDLDEQQIVGFEVDLAHAIADRLFSEGGGQVVLVPLLTAQKTDFVADGSVDLTISAVSMTCGRWEQVAFSAEYYTAHQQFLVRADSDIRAETDLFGRTICVTRGSSSSRILKARVPEAVRHEVDSRTDCLVALENGEVDAYFGHDTFLYGMMAQDPTVEIRFDVLDPEVTVSHYGIAIAREHEDFVRYVNGVLASLIDNGVWQELTDRHLAPLGIPPIPPPTPDYRRDHV